MQSIEQKLYDMAVAQNKYLLELKNRAENRGQELDKFTTFQYDRQRLLAMMDMLDAIDIDTSEFKWVYLV